MDAHVRALARDFHAAYELFAPDFGHETRPETRQLDFDSPNGRLMLAVCELIHMQYIEPRQALAVQYLQRIYQLETALQDVQRTLREALDMLGGRRATDQVGQRDRQDQREDRTADCDQRDPAGREGHAEVAGEASQGEEGAAPAESAAVTG